MFLPNAVKLFTGRGALAIRRQAPRRRRSGQHVGPNVLPPGFGVGPFQLAGRGRHPRSARRHHLSLLLWIVAVNRSNVDDLVVADEAHRCAGPTKSEFATILDPDKIKATRRLFMTATPRIFKNGRDDLDAVDMDGPAYGCEAYDLPFRKAIGDKLLVDYRIATLVSTNEEVKEHSFVLANVCAAFVEALKTQTEDRGRTVADYGAHFTWKFSEERFKSGGDEGYRH